MCSYVRLNLARHFQMSPQMIVSRRFLYSQIINQVLPTSRPRSLSDTRGINFPKCPAVLILPGQVLEAIKRRTNSNKLCNNHYLRGPCAKGDDCVFEHKYKATEEDMKAIAFLTRLNPCTSGQDCALEYCKFPDCAEAIKSFYAAHDTQKRTSSRSLDSWNLHADASLGIYGHHCPSVKYTGANFTGPVCNAFGCRFSASDHPDGTVIKQPRREIWGTSNYY